MCQDKSPQKSLILLWDLINALVPTDGMVNINQARMGVVGFPHLHIKDQSGWPPRCPSRSHTLGVCRMCRDKGEESGRGDGEELQRGGGWGVRGRWEGGSRAYISSQ